MPRKLGWLSIITSLVLSTFLVSIGPAIAITTGSEAVYVDWRLTEELSKTTEAVAAVLTFEQDGPLSVSQVEFLQSIGITSGIMLQSLPIAGVLLTAEQLDAITQRSDVASVFYNRQLQYDNNASTSLTGVDKTRTDSDFTKANGGFPVSGKGVTVLVNDSGVDGTHPDIEYPSHLLQNVAGQTNLNSVSGILPITYLEDLPNTDSNSGHGTHVAGIVGATGEMSKGKYEGVAPGAGLVGYGSGLVLFLLDTLSGFDYALTHQSQYDIRVVTNSWGDTGDKGTEFNPVDPINVATKKLYDRGIVTVFSAGNSGPGEGTITGNFKKAPWVIAVAAGDKQGRLANFSSRGVKGAGGTVTVDGRTFNWVDRPTITTPGVDIISTRVIAPVSSLSTTKDAEMIEEEYLAYYTVSSGTSMAAPHAAGAVALILDANPSLSPDEVKQIIQDTATNIPGMEPWEVGAGYINIHAAVDKAFSMKNYGTTLNLTRDFHSNVNVDETRTPFSVDYNPLTFVSDNAYEFEVPSGLTQLVAKVDAKGLIEATGNPVNLVLIAPDGSEYSSGISLLFTLFTDRTVAVSAPIAGSWKAEIRGLRGVAENPTNGASLPEEIHGILKFQQAGSFDGLDDIAGHPAEAAIKIAVNDRLVDGFSDRKFKPDQTLTRAQMADYLVMGAEVRQSLPTTGTFSDVDDSIAPFVEAVAAKGAAMRDVEQDDRGVMLPTGSGVFSPDASVDRVQLAYALVQSLGLEDEALARNGLEVTVQYKDERLPIEDASEIPAGLEGYVQVALDMNLVNAFFTLTQGPTDLEPTIHATFEPMKKVTRADYTVGMTRFYAAYLQP
jgi:serine protease AprX